MIPLKTGISLSYPFPRNGWFGWPSCLQAVFHLGMTTIFSFQRAWNPPASWLHKMRRCCNSGKPDDVVKNRSGNWEFGGSWRKNELRVLPLTVKSVEQLSRGNTVLPFPFSFLFPFVFLFFIFPFPFPFRSLPLLFLSLSFPPFHPPPSLSLFLFIFFQTEPPTRDYCVFLADMLIIYYISTYAINAQSTERVIIQDMAGLNIFKYDSRSMA